LKGACTNSEICVQAFFFEAVCLHANKMQASEMVNIEVLLGANDVL